MNFIKWCCLSLFLIVNRFLHHGQPVFRGGLAGDALENPGEIVGIGIAAGGADVLNIDPGILHHIPCFPNPVLVEVGGEIHLEALLEQLAEIGIGVIHGPGCIFHGQLFHVMAVDIGADILPYQGQPGVFGLFLGFGRDGLGEVTDDAFHLVPVVHGFPQGVDQLCFVIGLEDIVQGPQGNGLPGVGKAVIIADKENGAGFVLPADMLSHFQTGGSGHFDVEDHNTGLLPVVQFQCFAAVGCFKNEGRITQMLPQDSAQGVAFCSHVLCNQQFVLHSLTPLNTTACGLMRQQRCCVPVRGEGKPGVPASWPHAVMPGENPRRKYRINYIIF